MLVLPCLVLAGTSITRAQTAPTKVGVIQIQSAMVSTKDGQKAVADLDTKLAPRKKDLEKKQNDIRELQDKLQRGGNAMSDAAKNELTRNIDQKSKSYQRDVEDAEAEYQELQRKVLDELGQKMMQVIDKYAQTNGYSLILDVSNQNTPVLYASNAVDITKDIIDLYDKTAPSLTTTPSPARPPAAAPKPAAAPPAPATPAPAPAKPAATPPPAAPAPPPAKKQP
jgi:outer membrane protein